MTPVQADLTPYYLIEEDIQFALDASDLGTEEEETTLTYYERTEMQSRTFCSN